MYIHFLAIMLARLAGLADALPTPACSPAVEEAAAAAVADPTCGKPHTTSPASRNARGPLA
jgi:hypothetical protein